MKINIFLLSILTLFILKNYGTDIKTYEGELIKYFSHDDRSKEAVIFEKPGNGFAGCGPKCFTISDEDIVYVCDSCNKRIVKYDISFNFIEEIKSKASSYAKNIKISDMKDIFLIFEAFEIMKLDEKGNSIYSTYGNQIAENIFAKNNFFPINDVLFFYDNSNKLRLVDKTGKIKENTDAKQKLIKIHKNNLKQKSIENTIDSDIIQYSENNSLLIKDNKLYHPSYNEHKKYFKFKKQKVIKNAVDTPTDSIESLNILMDIFIGYDKDNNGYWRSFKSITLQSGKHKSIYAIVVVDSYGNILDYFMIDEENCYVQVSSKGDIYYMVAGVRVNGVAFYKIPRQW